MSPVPHLPESILTPLIIVGAGGHGRETLDVIEALNTEAPTFDLRGFVADEGDRDLLARRGVALLTNTEHLVEMLHETGARFHLAIGSSRSRAALAAALAEAGLADRAATLIHPLASLGSDLRFGGGVLLAAGARVTTNVTLGRHTHLNVNAVVSHDAFVGECVTLSPGVLINGNVTIGDRVLLGSGAIVLPGRTIGADAVIAAGAVVSSNVPAGATAIGVPARWA